MILKLEKETEMKITCYLLLVWVPMLSVCMAGDNSIINRTQSLMSELNVKPASDNELPVRDQGVLSAQKFKIKDNLIVSHKTESVGEVYIISDKLLFKDEKGKTKAVGKVIYTKSARAAQKSLFESLAMNSLPLELLLKRYEIEAEGPGDICVVETVFNKATGKFVVDEKQVHFIRGNIAISVRSEDTGVIAKELARQMDEMIIREKE
jgi:uncharacterized protein YxjI